MELFKTARFYQLASLEDIEEYEAALDTGDNRRALEIVDNFFRSGYPQLFSLEAERRKDPGYLELPPEPGDMVLVVNTNHYARLISISDDREWALVKEQWGVYPTQFSNLRRVR